MVQFPVQKLKEAIREPKWEEEAQGIFNFGYKTITIIGDWDDATALIAACVTFRRGDQLPAIPMPSTLLLAQTVSDGFRSSRLWDELFGRYLVLDEQAMPVPFTSKPDSFLIDKLHYAFNLLTVLVDKRSRHGLLTFFVTPKLVMYKPATTSFYAFYRQHSLADPDVQIVWKEKGGGWVY